jgi:deazaflavin-dependent oxidoreductase (nitroreductase family)
VRLEDLADRQFLYLTTTGRTSGRPREIEIWFLAFEGKLYLFAEHARKANWVQNILVHAAVEVRLGDERFSAHARVVDVAAEQALTERIRPLMQTKYGWSDGLPVEIAPA